MRVNAPSGACATTGDSSWRGRLAWAMSVEEPVMSEDALDAVMYDLRAFRDEREWEQFHTPSNLAKSISIEAAELLELFQWRDDADQVRIAEELADVLTYCLFLADRLDLDPVSLVRDKLEITRKKYPVERSRGRSTKYDRL